MTAAVGLPTLRLIRWSVGPWTLAGLAPGQWRAEPVPTRMLKSAAAHRPAATAPTRHFHHRTTR